MLSEIQAVFLNVFFGGAIMIASAISIFPFEFIFLGFAFTFGAGCYFYYRMDHPQPKIFLNSPYKRFEN